MAGNIVLNAGAGGATLGTDLDGSSVNWQVVKIGYSVSGTTPTQVSTGNPLPVTVPGSVAVTGAFFQATQPVSAVALPLPAGAATTAGQSAIITALGSPLQETGGSVSVVNFPATQPVSGTVAATQGTTPWVCNLTQVGGNPVVTGTGLSGAGIPRVTVSTDSSISVGNLPATQVVVAASLPLPANAAQESGGNLQLLAQLIEIERSNGATLRAILMQLSAMSGLSIDVSDLVDIHSLQ
jgi:hypothetical protein